MENERPQAAKRRRIQMDGEAEKKNEIQKLEENRRADTERDIEGPQSEGKSGADPEAENETHRSDKQRRADPEADIEGLQSHESGTTDPRIGTERPRAEGKKECKI